MNLLILRGIPGSGKTTFAKEWIKEEPFRARLNRDEIRMQLFGVWHGCDEEAVTEVQFAMLRRLDFLGYDVVIDDTNVKIEYLQKLVRYAANFLGMTVKIHVIDVPLELALSRNAGRERKVPEDVIISMHKELEENKNVYLF